MAHKYYIILSAFIFASSTTEGKTCPGFPGFCSESFPGQTCVVVCSRGRNNVPLCQEDGTWTDIPRCIEHEPGVENQIPGICPGIAGYCSEGYLNQECNFACSRGPPINSICTADGTWSPYPKCDGDIRETQDGCNPCPGPLGRPRNRTIEQTQGLPPTPRRFNNNIPSNRNNIIPTFSGNQRIGPLNFRNTPNTTPAPTTTTTVRSLPRESFFGPSRNTIFKPPTSSSTQQRNIFPLQGRTPDPVAPQPVQQQIIPRKSPLTAQTSAGFKQAVRRIQQLQRQQQLAQRRQQQTQQQIPVPQQQSPFPVNQQQQQPQRPRIASPNPTVPLSVSQNQISQFDNFQGNSNNADRFVVGTDGSINRESTRPQRILPPTTTTSPLPPPAPTNGLTDEERKIIQRTLNQRNQLRGNRPVPEQSNFNPQPQPIPQSPPTQQQQQQPRRIDGNNGNFFGPFELFNPATPTQAAPKLNFLEAVPGQPTRQPSAPTLTQPDDQFGPFQLVDL